MKSTRSWTKSLLTFLLVILLGVGIIGLGGCTSKDETDEPSIDEDSEQSVVSEDDETTAPTIYTEFPFDADEAQRRQEETADVLGIPVEYENEIGMKFRLIPAGEFMMGSPEDEVERKDKEHREENEPRLDDEQLHRVRLTKPYYLGVYEITQNEWKAVIGTTPWEREEFVREGYNYPATCVSWEDAHTFCERLSEIEERICRLPTEAEWEYACRAGTSTAFCFGNSYSNLDNYAWCYKNAGDNGQVHLNEVGQKRANAWGYHDMHGNVWEWCLHSYSKDYYVEPPSTDPDGPSIGDGRVFRGGSWNVFPEYCRSAYRHGQEIDFRGFNIGFRVVCEVDASE